VESTSVVKTNSIDVLAASAQPVLTLVTCYPFNYVGSARNDSSFERGASIALTLNG
jgi:sortase (surface protein transpeptidase)